MVGYGSKTRRTQREQISAAVPRSTDLNKARRHFADGLHSVKSTTLAKASQQH